MSCQQFSNEDEKEEGEDIFCLACKCSGQEVTVLIDTGCRMNLMSSGTVDRLGLKPLVEENKMDLGQLPFQRKLCIEGFIKELSLTIGGLRIMSSFFIVESTKPLMSLGSKTLKSLKCVIDTGKQMVVFGTPKREQVDFVKKPPRESDLDY
ncbi:hypothetical protein ATANTOWER_025214 [Ataeniobius toweri]|uniref:Aspartic peptidase DDI1-type domain-containing protein n=1 Tax=Ataeniobius toweri TaxID=208326 RepID=A0ABU7AKP1_9TELE|nr:hypothetical protein [Ataeniobius toweri]